MSSVWHGGWAERVEQRVRAHGYESLTDFADGKPSATYAELAAELGVEVAPIQVVNLLCAEAVAHGSLEHFARASLVRYLRSRLPAGWGVGQDFDFHSAHAFATWRATLTNDYKSIAERVVVELRASPHVYQGWLPSEPDDVVLVDAFRRAHMNCAEP